MKVIDSKKYFERIYGLKSKLLSDDMKKVIVIAAMNSDDNIHKVIYENRDGKVIKKIR